MHVASFAGIAPVNNPVISVAVVIDTPKGASYYGAAVSAPVFAEVAQQVLEYLGVPHDIDIRPPKTPAKPEKPAHEDDEDNGPDINALFAAVNDLPADDPLRDPAPPPAVPATAEAKSEPLPTQMAAAEPPAASPSPPPQPAPQKSVVLTADGERKVPELIGLPVRKVIEAAATAGLEVDISGSGTVREQAPVAGTVIGPNTRIVVRCSR
jgi:cell division protein FtsI (penicillin-binding protein 3)